MSNGNKNHFLEHYTGITSLEVEDLMFLGKPTLNALLAILSKDGPYGILRASPEIITAVRLASEYAQKNVPILPNLRSENYLQRCDLAFTFISKPNYDSNHSKVSPALYPCVVERGNNTMYLLKAPFDVNRNDREKEKEYGMSGFTIAHKSPLVLRSTDLEYLENNEDFITPYLHVSLSSARRMAQGNNQNKSSETERTAILGKQMLEQLLAFSSAIYNGEHTTSL